MIQIREFWNKHGSDIIKSLVVACILGVASWLLGLAWLKTAGMVVVHYLTADLTITRFWVFIGIGAGIVLGVGARRFTHLLHRSRADYDQDEVFGLLWEEGAQIQAGCVNLRAFCPKCQSEMLLDDRYGGCEYRCASCGLSQYFPKQDVQSVQQAVTREMDRRWRTGEWHQNRKRLRELRRRLESPS